MKQGKIKIVLSLNDPKKGFLIDKKFVDRVKRKIKVAIKNQEKVSDRRLCAEIISEFLETFEERGIK